MSNRDVAAIGSSMVRLSRGPRENRSRPAIDPLFRTAAISCRSRVIGVILTGLLNDGAAGLLAIKRCGGLAVVQSPEDAEHPEMPKEALMVVDADHTSNLATMGSLLTRLTQEKAPAAPPVPDDLILESHFLNRISHNPENEIPGQPSMMTCPDCGGILWEIRELLFAG